MVLMSPPSAKWIFPDLGIRKKEMVHQTPTSKNPGESK